MGSRAHRRAPQHSVGDADGYGICPLRALRKLIAKLPRLRGPGLGQNPFHSDTRVEDVILSSRISRVSGAPKTSSPYSLDHPVRIGVLTYYAGLGNTVRSQLSSVTRSQILAP